MVATKKSTGKVASKTPAKKPTPVAKKAAVESKVAPRKRTPKAAKPTVEQRLSHVEDTALTKARVQVIISEDTDIIRSGDLDRAVRESIRQGDDVSEAVSNCIQNDSDIITSDNIFQSCPSKVDFGALSNKVDSLSDTVDGLRTHNTFLWAGIILLTAGLCVAALFPQLFYGIRIAISGML